MPTPIYWLFARAPDQTGRPETFLSAAELEKFASFRFEKRRADWLLGRWTTKQLLQAVLLETTGEKFSRRELRIYNDTDGVPHVHNRPALTISISHANQCALCACIVAPDSAATSKLGADLEWIEPREDYLVRDYFTYSEQARVNASTPAERDTVVTAIWSAKEAALKAIQKGLSIDTHAVEITIPPLAQPPRAWSTFDVTISTREFPHSPLQGWWRVQDGFVLTLASDSYTPPQAAPVIQFASVD